MKRVRQWLIRNYNLVLIKSKCVKMEFNGTPFLYGDIIKSGEGEIDMKCLGKGYYKMLEDDRKE